MAKCDDCGLAYSDHGFPDLVIENWAWDRIAGGSGGLLCPNCICRRLVKKDVRCAGAFMSGNLESVSAVVIAFQNGNDVLMKLKSRIEALEDELDRVKQEPAIEADV